LILSKCLSYMIVWSVYTSSFVSIRCQIPSFKLLFFFDPPKLKIFNSKILSNQSINNPLLLKISWKISLLLPKIINIFISSLLPFLSCFNLFGVLPQNKHYDHLLPSILDSQKEIKIRFQNEQKIES